MNNTDNEQVNEPTCASCAHFIGAGDWNLCCELPHPAYPYGFLCYEDTKACKDYTPGTFWKRAGQETPMNFQNPRISVSHV